MDGLCVFLFGVECGVIDFGGGLRRVFRSRDCTALMNEMRCLFCGISGVNGFFFLFGMECEFIDFGGFEGVGGFW